MKKLGLIVFVFFIANWTFAQQIADTNYHPNIPDPVYEIGKGPIVFIDEGHYNFHTKEGRYQSFANLLEKDGYVVTEYKGEFNEDELLKGKILVISNAINEINEQNWYVPTPSAFTKTEIEVVKKWVNDGGSLFLIADHMPFGGAATDLAATFGFKFSNGFVMDTLSPGPAFFNLKEGTLFESIITNGRNHEERVEQIATFTGQGFKIPTDAIPVLIFGEKYVNIIPDTAWVFEAKSPRINAKGLAQGAYKKYGKGKVVAFGEAAMFSAQLAGPQKIRVGMNGDMAPENFQLLLNIIHWLEGKLD
ncbi:MAG: hypothetical protein CVU00_12125 [Bacteroidetes bacterium HGW-Bacteroidetes-17]|jgi:hypothetical protein|nr:MAG: hypothetical protein CVU00_12125 [Bacteroidetes bacterium HGW-Bacteroidetes-17]